MPRIELEVLDDWCLGPGRADELADLEVLAVNNLMAELAKLGSHPDNPKVLTRGKILEISTQKQFRLIVARDKDRDYQTEPTIVGMGSVHWRERLSGITAYIDDVAVLKDYAGHGIGRRIVQWLIDIARNAGSSSIELTSNPKREAANALYLKLGFVKQNDRTNLYKLEL